MKKSLLIGAVLLGIAIMDGLFLLSGKPRQEPIDPAVLEHKSAQDQEYLDFISENLVSGGVARDAIPAIDSPKYLSAEEAEDEGLEPDDIVFGLDYGGLVVAYPKKIMYWHEVVNEDAGGERISVTYCPLTESVIGYKGDFGVSGKLYNSNLVMYDRKTDSLWPQMLGIAVDGSRSGETLETIPTIVTSWNDWKAQHPDTLVLSRNTGFSRDYDRNPSPGYDDALRVWFPLAAESGEFHSKRIVHGIEHRGKALAITEEAVRENGSIRHGDLTISFNRSLGTIEVVDLRGNEPKHFDTYWFAWYAYHPDTEVVRAGE